jgi:hypothetical protein
MIYKLDEESKRRIEDIADLQEHVSAIHASVQAGEDGQEEIQISISLLPSFSTLAPSAEAGQIPPVSGKLSARSDRPPGGSTDDHETDL